MSTIQLVARMVGLIVGAMIVGAVLGWFVKAHAHSHYDKWQRPDGKGSCCNQLDCRPVSYRQIAAGIEIWITEIGQWHLVPSHTIMPFTSPDSDAHACYALSWGFGQPKRVPTVWCVALPFLG